MTLKTVKGKHIVTIGNERKVYNTLGAALKFLWGMRYES